MSRRFQFSLRALFKATALLAALCAGCVLAGGPDQTARGLASAFHFLGRWVSVGEAAASVAIYVTMVIIVRAVYVRNIKADARQSHKQKGRNSLVPRP
jgi:hypothetical protein